MKNSREWASGDLKFYNTSKMDLSKLGESGIKDNLESYLQNFSKDAREIFEYFKFSEFIGQLSDANLLYKIVQKVRKTDLSPQAISNHEMGLVFEELIRRLAESSNETQESTLLHAIYPAYYLTNFL